MTEVMQLSAYRQGSKAFRNPAVSRPPTVRRSRGPARSGAVRRASSTRLGRVPARVGVTRGRIDLPPLPAQAGNRLLATARTVLRGYPSASAYGAYLMYLSSEALDDVIAGRVYTPGIPAVPAGANYAGFTMAIDCGRPPGTPPTTLAWGSCSVNAFTAAGNTPGVNVNIPASNASAFGLATFNGQSGANWRWLRSQHWTRNVGHTGAVPDRLPDPAVPAVPAVRAVPQPLVYPQVNPMFDPFGLPIGQAVPVPTPLPWRLVGKPALRGWPETTVRGYATPTEARVGPLPNVVIHPGGGIAPGGNPGPPRPPPRRTRERKAAWSRGGLAWKLTYRGYNAITEGWDFAKALHNALPEHLRARRAKDIPKALWAHWRDIDLGSAFYELAKNEIGDRVIGRTIGRVTRQASRVGVTLGPAGLGNFRPFVWRDSQGRVHAANEEQ